MRTWGLLALAAAVGFALACENEDPLAGTGELGECFGEDAGYVSCNDYCDAQGKSCAAACEAGVGADGADESTDVAVYVGWSEPGTKGDTSGTMGTNRCSSYGVRVGKGGGACDDPVFDAGAAVPWPYSDVRCCCVE